MVLMVQVVTGLDSFEKPHKSSKAFYNNFVIVLLKFLWKQLYSVTCFDLWREMWKNRNMSFDKSYSKVRYDIIFIGYYIVHRFTATI